MSFLPKVPPQKTALAPSGWSRQLLGQRVVTVVFSATGRAANCNRKWTLCTSGIAIVVSYELMSLGVKGYNFNPTTSYTNS